MSISDGVKEKKRKMMKMEQKKMLHIISGFN